MQSAAFVSLAPAATLRAARPRLLLRTPRREQPSHQERYWPCNFLHAFTLQMSAHGQCVSASMMLGDNAYAREQLAHARQLDDETLRALTAALVAYFDEPLANARFAALRGHHVDALA
ncbi:MAG TPA: hypothetical protein VLJ57_10605 [Burkholderiaceae bacterium]|nr:hypothetical protein [Burkholderiaceae bacterium]